MDAGLIFFIAENTVKTENYINIPVEREPGSESVNTGTAGRPRSVRRFGVIDILIVTAIAAAAVAFIPVMRDAGPAVVCVRRDDRVIARYPLDRCAEFRVQGAEGPVDIKIDGEGVAVTRAACRNGICVRTGRVTRPGQRIICAPNHVVIEIRKAHADEGVDAVAR
jgi:hypothetical protein